MMVDLPLHYRNAAGVAIPPGVYEDTDPRLQGLAGYLVATEHATVVGEIEPPTISEDIEPPADPQTPKKKGGK